jgi:hypothetical protein
MIVKTIATSARTSPLGILLNPTFWIVICVWTALTAIYCVDVGAERERFKQQANTIEQLKDQADAAAKVLQRERDLRTEDRTEFARFKEESTHAKEHDDQLIADLRSDNRRLRVPIRRPAAPSADGSGSVAAGTGGEGYAELSADAGIFLVDLLHRGDEAIRKHGEVVDRYERLRIACTAPIE